jgi:hypothetical protein
MTGRHLMEQIQVIQVAIRRGNFEEVQRLVSGTRGQANVSVRDDRELFTELLWAAAHGRLEIVRWLGRSRGANIDDVYNIDDDGHGKTGWDHMLYQAVKQLSPLLMIILARGAPPSGFVDYDAYDLPRSIQELVAQGAVIRQRFPAESLWRAQRTYDLHASDCGLRLSPGTLGVIDGYSEVSEDELWSISQLQLAIEEEQRDDACVDVDVRVVPKNSKRKRASEVERLGW